jgi:carboxypeptidase Q
LTLFDPRPYP